jgi:hypothetical protein
VFDLDLDDFDFDFDFVDLDLVDDLDDLDDLDFFFVFDFLDPDEFDLARLCEIGDLSSFSFLMSVQYENSFVLSNILFYII